jgi:hypothetical protein
LAMPISKFPCSVITEALSHIWIKIFRYTCGRIDPIKVEQRARTAPDVTRYLKQESAEKASAGSSLSNVW